MKPSRFLKFRTNQENQQDHLLTGPLFGIWHLDISKELTVDQLHDDSKAIAFIPDLIPSTSSGDKLFLD